MGSLFGDFVYIGFWLFIFFITLLFGLISYIFQGIGLYKIAKKEGYDKPWLAWIPFANSFLYPILTENDVHKSLQGKFTLIYGIAFVLTLILNPYIPMISALTTAILIYAFYFIAKRYSERGVAHVVVAIITFGISVPFQVFWLRNRKPKIEVLPKAKY